MQENSRTYYTLENDIRKLTRQESNQPHDEEYTRFDLLINHAASQKERNACGKRSLLLPQSLGYGRAGDGDREKDAKPLQEWLETRRLKLALCRTERFLGMLHDEKPAAPPC
ncbi:hypothetical protein TNCV_979951 [Trichonephila clavipes]|uniref:Uncharacterized protein n=1 Tax=Trichonephila clavipes TaxID=2585209 RepID=A0A8X6VEB5_TRICX|nr:hypothetical protein TNCV_979951 [Trichonephila clavipes]